MVEPRIPEQGDIIWIDFSPHQGHEQAGHRPALVLSPSTYNQPTDLCLLCPITSRIKGLPFEVTISAGKIKGVVLTDQIRTMAWRERSSRFTSNRAPAETMRQVAHKLQLLLPAAN